MKMVTKNINTYSEQEERDYMKFLKTMGFKKTHDCMWVMIFEKTELDITIEIVISREY